MNILSKELYSLFTLRDCTDIYFLIFVKDIFGFFIINDLKEFDYYLKEFKQSGKHIDCSSCQINRESVGFVIQGSLVRSSGDALFLCDNTYVDCSIIASQYNWLNLIVNIIFCIDNYENTLICQMERSSPNSISFPLFLLISIGCFCNSLHEGNNASLPHYVKRKKCQFMISIKQNQLSRHVSCKRRCDFKHTCVKRVIVQNTMFISLQFKCFSLFLIKISMTPPC